MTDAVGDPIHCDTAIIGGGIVGCCLAYFLARAGVEVVLLEKHALCSQASGSNAGSIHEQMFLQYCTAFGRGGDERYAPGSHHTILLVQTRGGN